MTFVDTDNGITRECCGVAEHSDQGDEPAAAKAFDGIANEFDQYFRLPPGQGD